VVESEDLSSAGVPEYENPDFNKNSYLFTVDRINSK
jgi:hypothetical protein